MLLNFLYSIDKLEGKKKGASFALRSPLIEVVFDSDIDRFRPVVVNELGEVVFRDSDGGSVAAFSESIYALTGDYFRDSTEHRVCLAVGFTVEYFTEDIELFDGCIEGNRDIVDVSPGIDEVFEGILIEVEAFDAHICTRAFENVVVGDYAFDGIA